MISKSYSKNGRTARVTFDLPAEVGAETVSVCGDFNNWDAKAHPLKQRKDGSFSTTITLETGKEYRFRYLINGNHWENHWDADAYLPNDFGSEDSVLNLNGA